MQATYNWSIKSIIAKKAFTDKHGKLCENVIKTVLIAYTGTKGDRKEEDTSVINFDITDLSVFKPVDEVTNSEVLFWALNKLNSKERERIENTIKIKLDDIEHNGNMINIIISE